MTKQSLARTVALVVVLVAIAGAQQPPPSGARSTAVPKVMSIQERMTAEEQIMQILRGQTDAWNRGDLEGFMAGYWHSPELTFFSNSTQTKGWEPTLARYKKRYQGEGHAMGKLDFPEQKVTILSSDAAFVRGEFHLKMPDGKESHGMFTLVLQRFPNDGWKIVHDHSSGE
jgi:beta-aspartyl-peptidase (threonine type)